jgi:hypothetical protein
VTSACGAMPQQRLARGVRARRPSSNVARSWRNPFTGPPVLGQVRRLDAGLSYRNSQAAVQ